MSLLDLPNHGPTLENKFFFQSFQEKIKPEDLLLRYYDCTQGWLLRPGKYFLRFEPQKTSSRRAGRSVLW